MKRIEVSFERGQSSQPVVLEQAEPKSNWQKDWEQAQEEREERFAKLLVANKSEEKKYEKK
ncbi:MAG: hypothetical protein NUV47_03850 [Patescibacteria group bacterium]|nr:hypothetical protein [Patescibacteria group bacterium]